MTIFYCFETTSYIVVFRFSKLDGMGVIVIQLYYYEY